MELKGIVPALVTPFDGEGNVNYGELKKLVRLLLEEGADGFYVTGSTGECFLLTDEERIRITAAVAEAAEGRVPVIAHVGKSERSRQLIWPGSRRRLGQAPYRACRPFIMTLNLKKLSVIMKPFRIRWMYRWWFIISPNIQE